VAQKMTRKELRAPDALQRAGLEARHWMEGREKQIVILVVALLAVAFVPLLLRELSERAQHRAEGALGQALIPVIRPVAEPGQTPPADLPEAQKPFATQGEKDEAIVAALTGLRSEYGGTRSATTAALPLAQALYQLGRYDDALRAYGEFIQEAPKDDLLRATALEGQGYAYEAKGKLDEALRSYDALSRLEKTDFLDGMGLFHRARILILQGKKEEAAKALSEIPGAFPNSAAARMATERMNLLASQGVKLPSPAGAGPDAGTGS
jgi:tetratricopeptide (TPR) repeat protein